MRERLGARLARLEASSARLKAWIVASGIATGTLLFAALRLWPPGS